MCTHDAAFNKNEINQNQNFLFLIQRSYYSMAREGSENSIDPDRSVPFLHIQEVERVFGDSAKSVVKRSLYFYNHDKF